MPNMNHIIKQKLESQAFVQVATLTFRPGLQPSPNVPPAAFYDVSAQIQAMPGAKAVYLGQQMERPDHWTWAVRWASPAALDAFVASPSFAPWLTSFRQLADSYIFTKALLRGNLAAALDAPCTEVFTAYGASDSFLDARLMPFASAIANARLLGHHGSAYGRFDLVAQHGVDAPHGITVSLLIGWDTKAAHMAQRGEGKRTSLVNPLLPHSPFYPSFNWGDARPEARQRPLMAHTLAFCSHRQQYPSDQGRPQIR